MSEDITHEAITEAVSTGHARLPNGGLLMGMPLADFDGCPIEAVLPDGHHPCELGRGHDGDHEFADEGGYADEHPAPELAAVIAERDRLAGLLRRYERITTAWTRGMYSARIDCVRGDVKAAIRCLSEGLDGYDGTEWNGTETGTEWWERTKAEEGL